MLGLELAREIDFILRVSLILTHKFLYKKAQKHAYCSGLTTFGMLPYVANYIRFPFGDISNPSKEVYKNVYNIPLFDYHIQVAILKFLIISLTFWAHVLICLKRGLTIPADIADTSFPGARNDKDYFSSSGFYRYV